MKETLLNAKQIADYLQVSVRHIHRLCKDGTFQYSKDFFDIRCNGCSKPSYRFKLDVCLTSLGDREDTLK